MKIAFFTNEVPFPANHGGRVDTWTRMQALNAGGARMALVSWYPHSDTPLPQSTLHTLSTVASSLHLFAILPTWGERFFRLGQLFRWPSQVSSRVLKGSVLAEFWRDMDEFLPEAVWLDALYPSVLANACAQRYAIPIFYRSHNIEHRYMLNQVVRATNWRDRIAWALNLPNLKRIEMATMTSAHTVFDISIEDLQWWRQQGLKNNQWLPPSMPHQMAASLSAPLTNTPPFDVGYLGNLRTPNNVEGILWFLKQVWPQVLAHHPASTMLLAGSSPVQHIRAAAATAQGVTLLENAPDASAVLRNARVLVNPIFAGSGVNIKSVEMLFAPGQRVSTSQGVAGLPAHVKQCFHVADDAPAFTQAIQAALGASTQAHDAPTAAMLNAARSEFGAVRIQQLLAYMQSVCDARIDSKAKRSD